MAITALDGPIAFPTINTGSGSGSTILNHLLDAATEKSAAIFKAGKDGTISKVIFTTNTVTTGTTLDIRLETRSLVNGDPTGTLLAANTNGSQVVGAGDDNTTFTTSLTSGAVVTQGDPFFVVIANSGSGDLQIRAASNRDFPTGAFPYVDLFTAAWAKSNDTPIFGLEYSDGSYVVSPGTHPLVDITTDGWDNTSSPDEIGIIFQKPIKFRVVGFWFKGRIDDSTDVVLYDSDGSSVLETVSLDTDVKASTNIAYQTYPFVSSHTLDAATNYRLVLKPTVATATATHLRQFEVATAAMMDGHTGGQNVHRTERTDAGAFSQTTTKRPMMGVLIDGFESGGLLTHPGLLGGIRG